MASNNGKTSDLFGDVSNYLIEETEINEQINIENEPLISTLNEQFVIKPAAAQEKHAASLLHVGHFRNVTVLVQYCN